MDEKRLLSGQNGFVDGSYSTWNESIAVLPYSAFDSSRLATYIVSVTLIVYGSFRSLNLDSQQVARLSDSGCSEWGGTHRQSLPVWCHWHILGSWQAALMPLAASVSLLVMFLYFESLQLIFVIATCVLATAAFAFLLLPLCQMLLAPCSTSRSNGSSVNILCFGRYQPSEVAAAMGGASLVALWLITGHWLLMDLLAMGLCVAFIALVRLPSLKVSTLLLVGLLLYDIFWVFFSSYLFQTNVMVRVATRQVDSPLAMLVGTFKTGSTAVPITREQFVVRSSAVSSQLPVHSHERISAHRHFIGGSSGYTFNTGHIGSATKLSLPGKLVFPSWQSGRYTMLGLGDIVVPGLLLCFVLRYDAFKRKQIVVKGLQTNSASIDATIYSTGNTRLTYFRCSLVGYFLGLLTATICSEVFRSAQPALLYLVPFTLIPLLFMAYFRGDLKVMWHEPFPGMLSMSPSSSASSPALLMSTTVVEGNCDSTHNTQYKIPSDFDSPPPYSESVAVAPQNALANGKCTV